MAGDTAWMKIPYQGDPGKETLRSVPVSHSKYHREIKPGVFCDVYSVLVAFGVTNPADAHAIKKLLMPGMRGHKDGIQDRREAIASIQRAIEIEEGSECAK